jgi:hypothetical protein
MKYADGKQASLGDRVKLWHDFFGTIVCSIDDEQYAAEFSREHWAYKGRGVVVKADDGRLFYYDEADEDFELLQSAGPGFV